MFKSLILTFTLLITTVAPARPDATIPKKDIKGASDSELVGRLNGAFIIDYVNRDFDEATFPLSKLKAVDGERNSSNNVVFRPDKHLTIEGARTRIVYLNTDKASPFQVLRGYQAELKKMGAEELYRCKGE